MKKTMKLMVVMMFIVVAVLTAGCGDKFKGDWMQYKIGFNGEKYMEILHLEAADSGGYIATFEQRGYETVKGDNSFDLYASDHSHILNIDESFEKDGEISMFMFASGYKWNGTTLKTTQKYKWRASKNGTPYQLKKEDMSLKDGKLYFHGNVYEKTDENKLAKMKEDWKNKLKSQVGKEIKIDAIHRLGSIKNVTAVPVKVTIVENGKEEVFEKD